jgi:hypothetical protein
VPKGSGAQDPDDGGCALTRELGGRIAAARLRSQAGERRRLSNLRVLALLVREQPTVREALEALANYIHLHSDGLRLTIDEAEGFVTIGLAVERGRPVPIRQAIELGLGVIHRSLEQLLGTSWRPQTICFTHAGPVRTDAHRQFRNNR